MFLIINFLYLYFNFLLFLIFFLPVKLGGSWNQETGRGHFFYKMVITASWVYRSIKDKYVGALTEYL